MNWPKLCFYQKEVEIEKVKKKKNVEEENDLGE